jgi:predicted transcriptional regulator
MSGLHVTILIMAVSGIAGGLLNYVDKKGNLYPCLLSGVIAVFIVPLFLAAIGNNIVDKILFGRIEEVGYGAFFQFAAFCLIASVSARRFMDTMTKRILNLAEEADQKATAAQEDVKERRTEIQTLFDTLSEDESISPTRLADSAQFSADKSKLIRAFHDGTIPLRSVDGLAITTGMQPELVANLIQELDGEGLVSRAETPRGPRWRLTQSGRGLATRLSDAG